MGWQPIDSAPRDGTNVLLWERWMDVPFVGRWLCGSWSANTEHYAVSCGAFCYGGNVSDEISQKEVTHWMPLPAPPKEQA